MEIDLAEAGGALDERPKPRAFVCVVGGGIAGLVLADRLATSGIEVLLLEGGGVVPELAEQRLAAEVCLSGQPHLGTRDGRTWALGGASVTWGGQLLPLAEEASWPVSPGELQPHYATVERMLGVDALPYEAEAFWAACGEAAPEMPGAAWGLEPQLSKFAPFGRRNLARSLGKRLRAHALARVAPHGRAVRLLWGACGESVEAVEVRLRSGVSVRVPVQLCVLAAGTVETCRLLLASTPPGAGQRWIGQVGRNFHDHLTVQVAVATGEVRRQVIGAARPWMQGGVRGTAHALKLVPTPELRRRLRVPPALAHWTFTEPEGTGLSALRGVLRARQQGGDLWGAAGRLPGAARDGWRLYREAQRHGRRLVTAHAEVALRINMAQDVPSLSSVKLSPELDAAGQPRAHVDWQVGSNEVQALAAFATHLREALSAMGMGEKDGLRWRSDFLRCADGAADYQPPEGLEDARHAMGGACMGTDPDASVVDPSLRVHGVRNLYVASAAVFPDGSPHLPTLTLMALTLRLAEHLERKLAS